MGNVSVLIVSRIAFHRGYMEDIAAVDPRVSVRDATGLFAAELRREGKRGIWVDHLEEAAADMGDQPGLTLKEDFDALLAEAEVVYAMTLIPENLTTRAPKLKWIHLGNAGIEGYLSAGITDPSIVVTNSRGSHAVGIGEHVMALVLALAKGFPRLLVNKQDRRWERFVTMEVRDRVMGIIGLGAIGTEAARLARGIGMKVIGTKRSATTYESGVSGVDELYPRSDLRRMLSQSDFVVIAAPLTAETKGMIGEAELRAMKPTAFLVNISRGAIVNQGALTLALQQGWIAGAGLDAFETEPLPSGSDLWGLPNVILSPHMSGFTDRRSYRHLGLFCENLRRYLEGENLMNIVDAKRGY